MATSKSKKKKNRDSETEQAIALPSGSSEAIKGQGGPPVQGTDFSSAEGEPSRPEVEEVPETPTGNPMPVPGAGPKSTARVANPLSIEIKLSLDLPR